MDVGEGTVLDWLVDVADWFVAAHDGLSGPKFMLVKEGNDAVKVLDTSFITGFCQTVQNLVQTFCYFFGLVFRCFKVFLEETLL